MNRFKHKLAATLLGLYGTMAIGAAGSELLQAAECAGWLGREADSALQASGGEGGGDSWQAFLPGMLK